MPRDAVRDSSIPTTTSVRRTGSHPAPREYDDLPGLRDDGRSSSMGAGPSPAPHPLEDLPGLKEGVREPSDLPDRAEASSPHSADVLQFIDDKNALAGGAKERPVHEELRLRHRDGRVEGPFGVPRLQAMLRNGELMGQEDVSTDGVRWRAMTSHPALNETIEGLYAPSDPMDYGQVDLPMSAGTDLPAPHGIDYPAPASSDVVAPANLPDAYAPPSTAALDEYGELKLDTGALPSTRSLDVPSSAPRSLDVPSRASSADVHEGLAETGEGSSSSMEALMKEIGGSPSRRRGGPSSAGSGSASSDLSRSAAMEVLEVGEIPELPSVWQTYRKHIIAFVVAVAVVSAGVYTHLFTPAGFFGIPGLVRYALTPPPPPPPPAPPPPPPKKVDPEALSGRVASHGYEGFRSVFATLDGAPATSTNLLVEAHARVRAGLLYGLELFRLDEIEAAVSRLEGQDLTTADAGQDGSLKALETRAGLSILKGDAEGALALLEPASSDAMGAPFHWLTGLALSEQDKLREAMAAFDRALVAESEFAPASWSMGRMAKRLEDPETAAWWFDRTSELAPEFGPAPLAAAETYEALGQPGEARRARLAAARIANEGLPTEARPALYASVGTEMDARGEVARVADLVREGHRLKPSDPQLAALAAVADVSQDRIEDALSKLSPILDRESQSVPALLARARAQIGTDNVAKAFLDLEAVRKIDPRDPRPSLHEAEFNQALGKMKDARNALRRAARIAPKSPRPRMALARLELESGAIDSAVEHARAAVKLAPRDARARTLLADGLARQGALQKALAVYRKAEAFDSNEVGALVGQANVLRDMASKQPDPSAAEQLSEAIPIYVRALREGPTDPKVMFEFGRALELDGELQAALALYAGAAALDDEDVRPHLRMAAAFVERNPPDMKAASKALNRAQAIENELGHDDDRVRFWEARVAYLERRFADAVTSMRRAVEREPTNAEYQYWLGRALERNNSLFEAITAYEKALQLNSRFSEAMRALGWTAVERHQYRRALKWFNAYRQQEPQDASVYTDIGTSYSKQNKDRRAMEAFQKALRANPSDEVALVSLANILSRFGREPQAQKYLKRAVSLNAENADAACLLGLSLASRRVTPESRVHLQRCVDLPHAPEDLQEAAEELLLTGG